MDWTFDNVTLFFSLLTYNKYIMFKMINIYTLTRRQLPVFCLLRCLQLNRCLICLLSQLFIYLYGVSCFIFRTPLKEEDRSVAAEWE